MDQGRMVTTPRAVARIHQSASQTSLPRSKNPILKMRFFLLAGPTGFEPAISSVTGRRVRPDYTTGPRHKLYCNLWRAFHKTRLQFFVQLFLLKVTNSYLLLIYFITRYSQIDLLGLLLLGCKVAYNLAMVAQSRPGFNAFTIDWWHLKTYNYTNWKEFSLVKAK